MGGSCAHRRPASRPQVLFAFLLPLFHRALGEPVRYSIPEELAKGSVVGNLAKDLGLSVLDVTARKLRVNAEKLLFTVDAESGDLLVKDRIDREQICREKRRCELQLEAVVENPLNIFHITVVVEDINDHAPRFEKEEMNLDISEFASLGMGMILDSAKDLDIGMNSLSKYQLSPNEYFSLVMKDNPDGGKYPELVLKKNLDREAQSTHHLVLTAIDSGDPPRSGTTQIRIKVVDANDNAPQFSQNMYRVSLSEDVPPGTSVLRVKATDPDEGINAEITYSFVGVTDKAQRVFSLDSDTGTVTTHQPLDFEDVERYIMDIEAKDRGSLSTQCKVIIEVLDENDNSPEIIITSLSDEILEDSRPGMVVALFKTRDRDSGENGEVTCNIGRDVPFKILSSGNNYYKLVTDGALDREQTPEYNVTITATDRGNLISVLFLLAVILAIALRLRHSSSPAAQGCFGSVLCSKPEIPPNYSEGTLPYAYNLCVPGDQTNAEFNFLTSVDHCPATQDILNKDSSSVLLANMLTPTVDTDKTSVKQAARNFVKI
nr:unnamed protein product [Sorex araneus]